jgi:hypothetical protein
MGMSNRSFFNRGEKRWPVTDRMWRWPFRPAVVAGALLGGLVSGSPLLADLEDDLNRHWRGAWVVIQLGVTSGCSGSYTNNEVHGNLVSGRGSEQFDPGEVASVHKVNVGRKRLELLLDLDEPILKRRQDGPFTLLDEASCKVELRFDLKDRKATAADQVESMLQDVVFRFSDRMMARNSEMWNGRIREPYPENYEETLAEYENWKVFQANAAVQEQIEISVDEAARLIDRLDVAADYLTGFGEGIDDARESSWTSSCDRLVSMSESSWTDSPDRAAPKEWQKGYTHGQRLVFHVERARRLRNCFIPPPGF